MSARHPAPTTPDRLRLLPIVELLSGRTVDLELLDADALDEAAACAGVWRRVWPDVGLVVPLPAADPVDRVRHALEGAGLEASALAVEVSAASTPEALSAVEALGVRMVVRAPGADLDEVRRRCGADPAIVKVSSGADLGSAVAAARRVAEHVVVTGVGSIVEVSDAGQAGADAAQGAYLGAPLEGLDAVLAHLAEEVPVTGAETVVDRVAELEARAVQVEALVGELSDVEGRGAGRAAPRSGRTGPRDA